MRVNRLPPLPIIAPPRTPAIELPRYAEAGESAFTLRHAWERDEAIADGLVPAHELQQLQRREP